MNQLPTRAEIDDQYKWDTSTVFESTEDWGHELSVVHARLDDLRDYEGRIARDGETLLNVLRLFEEILRRTQRLHLYAQLKRNEDIEDGVHQERLHESNLLNRDVTKVTDLLRREIQDTGRDTIKRAVGTLEGLEVYDHFLDDVLRMSTRARSPAVEDLLADLTEVIESPTRIYTTLTNNDVKPQPVTSPEGERVDVTAVNLGKHLRHPDRSFRRCAYQSVHEAYAAVEHTIATAYADKVKAQVALADARNYDSVREMAFNKPSYPETGLHVHLPVEVHDSLTAGIRGSIDPFHRCDERRKAVLGLDELEPWDLDVVPSRRDEPTVTYEEAWDHILSAVEPLGEEYRERLGAFLDARRIDVYETKRKQNILGYSVSSYDTGSYLLLNYQDDVRSMSILAHELGHAMHAEFHRDAQPPVYSTGPRPVEEVPSYVNELLLAYYLMDGEDEALCRYVRGHLLNNLVGGLYGATMHSLLTHEAYGVVEAGEELTLDRIEGIYTDLLSEFRPLLGVDTWAKRDWLVGSHARLPYHYYQYPLGVTGALLTVERLLDGELSPAEYYDFLRAGGSIRSLEAFESLELAVRTPQPFERACSVVGDHVSELNGSP